MITNRQLERAWDEVASQLRGYIRTRVYDHAAAEDILQDVFLKAQSRATQLESTEKVSGWLFQIARNAVADHFRTVGARAQRIEQLPDIPDFPAEETVQTLECEEKLLAAFREMILELPEPYREALLLTEYEGLSQKGLSERLNISFSGAKSRVQRGREKLRQAVLECCALNFDRRGNVIDCIPRKGQCDCGPERGL